MCLFVDVEADALPDDFDRELRTRIPALDYWWGPRPPRLSIHGCELLSEAADWDSATWEFSSSGRDHLIHALQIAFDHARGTVTVEAYWDGDRKASGFPVTSVSPNELVELIAADSLAARTKYEVALNRHVGRAW